jgi:hypothetical protein
MAKVGKSAKGSAVSHTVSRRDKMTHDTMVTRFPASAMFDLPSAKSPATPARRAAVKHRSLLVGLTADDFAPYADVPEVQGTSLNGKKRTRE